MALPAPESVVAPVPAAPTQNLAAPEPGPPPPLPLPPAVPPVTPLPHHALPLVALEHTTTAPQTTALAAPPAAVAPVAPLRPAAPNAPQEVGGGGGTNTDPVHPNCFLPLQEFAEDIELKLGRANGNIFHRREGIEGVHDGQIMVRLKKKRFIVIDYGILPTAIDVAAASINPHVSCPAGAGKQKCVTAECPKRGVPVLLYDSDPSEPSSLYLRSGLCFTCQRILNEKRRTQRKRKSDAMAPPADDLRHAAASGGGMHPHSGPHGEPHGHGGTTPGAGPGGDSFHHMDPAAAKRFRLNGDIVDLSPDAIIINGPLDGTKHHGPGYGFVEIGMDLASIVAEAARATERLVGCGIISPVSSQHVPSASPSPNDQNDNAVAVAAAAAAAAAVAAVGQSGAVDALTAAAVEATATATAPPPTAKQEPDTALATVGAPNQPQVLLQPMPPPTEEEIPVVYERAFLSLSRAIYLLSQWKASRDAHDAEESARKAALEVPHIPLSSMSGEVHGAALRGLVSVNADTVAAAAAAAVASAGVAHNPPLPPVLPHHAGPVVGSEAAPPAGGIHPPHGPVMSAPAVAAAGPPLPSASDPTAMSVPPNVAAAETMAAPAAAEAPASSHAIQNVAANSAAALNPSAENGSVNTGSDGSPSGMIPLLLVAEGRKEDVSAVAAPPNVRGDDLNEVVLPAPQQDHTPQQAAVADVSVSGALDSAAFPSVDPPGSASASV